MKFRADRLVFSGVRAAALAAATTAALAATGCAGPAMEDGALVAAADPASPGPINTGSFPNLNIKPEVAGPQFTPEERAAKLAALRAAQQHQSPGQTGETEEARRKRLKLLADDQNDTLKVIEDN
jgi:uncharacterized membrane protein